ncbi:AaceriADR234Cp [[Ashbya] aceris (nom. inval.)]|nr:AaceriADR234Cp [[Ashbya] aceris (nom. inval.)]
MARTELEHLATRLERVEQMLGEASEDGDVGSKVRELMRQLQGLCDRGLQFNEQMGVYLQQFLGDGGQPGDGREVAAVVETCHEELQQLVAGLQALELRCHDGFGAVVAGCGTLGSGAIEGAAVDALWRRCNALVARSAHVTARFLRLARARNEAGCAAAERLRAVERAVRSPQ